MFVIEITMLRGFTTGVVSAGLSCVLVYRALSEPNSPHIEFEENVKPKMTGMLLFCSCLASCWQSLD